MVGNYGVGSSALGVEAAACARGTDARGARAGVDRLAARARHRRALGIDTRSLVLHLRERGAMRAAAAAGDVSVDETLAAVREQPPMAGRALVADVSTDDAYAYSRVGRRPRRGRRLRRQALDPRAARRRGRSGRPSTRTTSTPTSSRSTTASCSRTGPATPRRSSTRSRAVRELLGRVPGARHLPRPPAARARRRA